MKNDDRKTVNQQRVMRGFGVKFYQRLDIPITKKYDVAWVAYELQEASKELFKISRTKQESFEAIYGGKLVLERLRNNLKYKINYEKARLIKEKVDEKQY